MINFLEVIGLEVGKYVFEKEMNTIEGENGLVTIKDLKISYLGEDLFLVSKDFKNFVIEKDGTIVKSDLDMCWRFQEGFAKILKNEKYGWMNSKGYILMDELDQCTSFKQGFGKFLKNGKEGWIDTSGKIYTEQPY